MAQRVPGKAVPLQAWSGPEDSRKLRLPDLMTTQDGGKVVCLRHQPPLPPGNTPGAFAGNTATAAQSDLLVFRFRISEALPPHSTVRSLKTEAAFRYKLSSMQAVLLFTV